MILKILFFVGILCEDKLQCSQNRLKLRSEQGRLSASRPRCVTVCLRQQQQSYSNGPLRWAKATHHKINIVTGEFWKKWIDSPHCQHAFCHPAGSRTCKTERNMSPLHFAFVLQERHRKKDLHQTFTTANVHVNMYVPVRQITQPKMIKWPLNFTSVSYESNFSATCHL